MVLVYQKLGSTAGSTKFLIMKNELTIRQRIRGTLYRATMRIAHRFNWHRTTVTYIDGDMQLWCQWCGLKDSYPIDSLWPVVGRDAHSITIHNDEIYKKIGEMISAANRMN